MSVKYLPDNIVKTKKVQRHMVYTHYFCAYCGKELTKLDFKTGNLWQQQHIIGFTEDGLTFRFCLRRDVCHKRRMRKKNRL